ncbi:hypothetical protein IMG5_199260 [Ichthyophthirius multifiliis]|uniref:carbonic anhydrase n=1 Tax=Ichthyophthirius multifiliis TaxID=5932 RepID=G0R5I7_ICHMU|nr:hypothetical protein IMG5_199260 [Ichthyophthirius multifiliis]EGR27247.1 hypothetical protein IMG5_199260 [Ichthyophthirius multifiliis]|eukprot:XP_004024131.1 hypothetical protein IMG5_199260 [Ichthyophthirius multifiliis]
MSFIHLQIFDYTQHGENWGGKCATGQKQSPIDINVSSLDIENAKCLTYKFKYDGDAQQVKTINNLHSVEIEGHFMKMQISDIYDKTAQYQTAQFHVHEPSEHTLDGVYADLELHLVNKKVEGDSSKPITVIGVLFQKTLYKEDESQLFKEFQWPAQVDQNHLKPTETSEYELNFQQIFSSFLYDGAIAYRYEGSLTTPGCDEVVNWYVLREAQKIHHSSYKKFKDLWFSVTGDNVYKTIDGNNRKTQPLNGRAVEVVVFCFGFIQYFVFGISLFLFVFIL